MHTTLSPVIEPLVRRHAQDAAFYWMQLDSSLYSPRFGLEGIQRFDAMLEAHLEGLDVAGADGWRFALEAFDRWKKPGEAFVCAWLALHAKNDEWANAVFTRISANPDGLMRAVISALAWQTDSGADIAAWSTAEQDALHLVAALRAVALGGCSAFGALNLPIAAYLQARDEHVRAAACRAAVFAPDEQAAMLHLGAALKDVVLQVRVEAAIALASIGQLELAAPTLWQGLLTQVETHAAAKGWQRSQALRRLMRWVRFFASLAPLGHPNIPALLGIMPVRVALGFIAYHGDLAHLPFVLEKMKDPDHSRYAGWVLSALTGRDLREAGLAVPDPDPQDIDWLRPISDARLDADQGLALPDVDAVASWYAGAASTLPQGQRHLAGALLGREHARAILESAPQALRSIAAQSLIHQPKPCFVSLRGTWQSQQASFAALGGLA